jgi:hypothetical protein
LGTDGKADGDATIVEPVVEVSCSFPATSVFIVKVRELIRRDLAESPPAGEDDSDPRQAMLQALLNAASADGLVRISVRFSATVREGAGGAPAIGALPIGGDVAPQPFRGWLATMLQRKGLTQEAAARELGVSVRTVGRWIGGWTEPRLKELRRIYEVFGEAPPPSPSEPATAEPLGRVRTSARRPRPEPSG